MKVLQINSVCGVGSTGRIATDIHKILLKKEYESYIAYGRGVAKNCGTAIRIGNNNDIYSHIAKTRAFDKHGFGSKKATKDFIKKIRDVDPDIIHLHNIHGYYINVEMLFDYLKNENKPVIWTLHDCWAFTGHCAYFDYVGCNNWKTQCMNCPEIRSYPASFLRDNSKTNFLNKKRIFNGVNNLTIVTPSKWLADLVNESILREYPVKVINNGIDIDVFQPIDNDFRKRYNLEEKFIILGVASTWDRRKGYKYFNELSNRLQKDEVIILVGLTEKQKEKLPENIIGITKTQNVNELVEIYSTSDVFVNPTMEDNFPTTNIEALACGTPVITFNTGGSVESIDDNCGYIVEKGNVSELYERINDIKNKSKNYYMANCTSRAMELFNKEKRFYEYIELYEKCR
ncbi:glycosyltransferase [Bacillus salipaludis]|uniref:glycosyltransferase n=1 Tax=Bacillus salipaludis TaxID=2547811 RepID=UPI003D2008B4